MSWHHDKAVKNCVSSKHIFELAKIAFWQATGARPHGLVPHTKNQNKQYLDIS